MADGVNANRVADCGSAGEDGEPVSNNDDSVPKTKKSTSKIKKKTPGVVYLSYIPPKMDVRTVRNMLSKYGELGRIFLQPEKHTGKSRTFTEGWVEFLNKKVAKSVALALNGTQVGGKRRAEYYYSLWSIKYLHRFRWTHLNERLAYEKAVRDQRLRTEIAQAKRESNFYIASVEKSKRMRRVAMEHSGEQGPEGAVTAIDVRQRATDDQVLAKRSRKQSQAVTSTGPDFSLLKTIFAGGASRQDEDETDFRSTATT